MAKLIQEAQSWAEVETCVAESIERNAPRFVGTAHAKMIEQVTVHKLIAERVQRAVNEAKAEKPKDVNRVLKEGLVIHVLRLIDTMLADYPSCKREIYTAQSKIESMVRRGNR